MKVSIQGLQKAQEANMRLLAAVKPSGALGRAVKEGVTLALHRSIARTHVDTGALRASHRGKLENASRGRVSIDANAAGARRGAKPSVYGPYEHARGGSHAFYQRVEQEDGSTIARAMMTALVRGLP